MRYLKKAATEQDLTTVTSLHQVNIAREFGDRFLGIRDGQVIFDGDADALTMDAIDQIYYGTHVTSDATPENSAPAERFEADATATTDGGDQP